ncbi:hypothetical protein JKF63_00243 [Porcisia hertigi]|uniref:Uncharacterized protein n=1 Tax=Porcisia hertigi TaxID=2761500 RepID=A0A836HCS6_9TRYP|nr:hypothetical protein JKF63_00243 [Porcisia hertigi]
MLQWVLATVPSTGLREVENALQQSWASLLQLEGAALNLFCSEAESFLKVQLAKTTAPTDDVAIFIIIYVAALHAIHAGLAAPVRWTTAQDSPFRASMSTEPPLPARTEAARVIASVCERILLVNAEMASGYFGNLLRETAMGVPLLALVLRTYGEVAVDILPGNSEVAQYPQSCINHLVLATHTLTEATSDDTLTIAHPILLHVARVSGCTREVIQLLSRPTYCINPLLTGIGLSDYVAHYAEAALFLAAHEQYESATYALVPLSRLPLTHSTRESKVGSRDKTSKDGIPVWLETLEDEEADGHDAIPCSDGGGANPIRTSVTGASNSLPAQQQLQLLYPWYRTEPVGKTHKYTNATEAKDGSDGVDIVVSPDMWTRSAVERKMDRRAVAWANRLGIVLLAAAFGGGSPRGVMAFMESARRQPAEDEEAPLIWGGMESAITDHVCFPHPLFSILTETTLISLHSFLHVTMSNKETSARAYTDLLKAIVRRDTANAQQCLSNAANVALFTADLTLDLVKATVLRQLPRHILLDMARMYVHVPMQMLLDRTQITPMAVETSQYMQAKERSKDKTEAPDTTKVNRGHALVWLLADMCATGELSSCHVCIDATPSADAAANAHTTSYAIEEVVGQLSNDAASLAVLTATVKWTMSSPVARLQRCAQIVQFQMNQNSSANIHTTLVQLLVQLQELREAVDADAEGIRDVQLT